MKQTEASKYLSLHNVANFPTFAKKEDIINEIELTEFDDRPVLEVEQIESDSKVEFEEELELENSRMKIWNQFMEMFN